MKLNISRLATLFSPGVLPKTSIMTVSTREVPVLGVPGSSLARTIVGALISCAGVIHHRATTNCRFKTLLGLLFFWAVSLSSEMHHNILACLYNMAGILLWLNSCLAFLHRGCIDGSSDQARNNW